MAAGVGGEGRLWVSGAMSHCRAQGCRPARLSSREPIFIGVFSSREESEVSVSVRSHLLPGRDVANSNRSPPGLLHIQDGPQGRLSNSPQPALGVGQFPPIPLRSDSSTGKAVRFSPCYTCSIEILCPFTLKFCPSSLSGVTYPFWMPVRAPVISLNELPGGGGKSADTFSAVLLTPSVLEPLLPGVGHKRWPAPSDKGRVQTQE